MNLLRALFALAYIGALRLNVALSSSPQERVLREAHRQRALEDLLTMMREARDARR